LWAGVKKMKKVLIIAFMSIIFVFIIITSAFSVFTQKSNAGDTSFDVQEGITQGEEILPSQSLLAGRWQSVTSVNNFYHTGSRIVSARIELICIMEIKTDGSVIIERYDTITLTRNREFCLRSFGFRYLQYYNASNRNGSGTGRAYNAVLNNTNDNQAINAALYINLAGINSGINNAQNSILSMNLITSNRLFSTPLSAVHNSGANPKNSNNDELYYNSFTRLE
jgi:hypothetical protein